MASNLTDLTTTMASNLTDLLDNTTTTDDPVTAPAPNNEVIQFPYFICLGILIFSGFVTNSLSVAVFVRAKDLRQSTTGLYLVSLAVADILFLLGDLLRWLSRHDILPGYTFLVYSNSSCQFVYTLRYWGKLASAWITVIITAQRFLIVTFPLKAGSLCTRRKAYIGIAVTYVLCLLAGAYPIFTLGITEWNGRPLCGYTRVVAYDVLSWVFLRVGSLLLPGAIVIVLTVLICTALMKARLVRRQTLNESRVNGNEAKGSDVRSKRSIDMQLTAMLLAVAIAFVLLRLPYTILYYVYTYRADWGLGVWTVHRVYIAYKISDLLATTNYAVNFFLYCLSGSTFRQQFLSMFRCYKGGHGGSSRTLFGPTTGSTTVGHDPEVKGQGRNGGPGDKSLPLAACQDNNTSVSL